MRNARIHYFVSTVGIAAALIMTAAGCATHRHGSPVPEEVRKQVRTVAVVPAAFVPVTNLHIFAKGRDAGAGKGAAEGAASAPFYAAELAPLMIMMPPVAALVIIAGAVAGGIEGSVKAMPADEAKKIEAFISDAAANIDVQRNLAEQIVFSGTSLTGHRFSLMKGQGPAAQDEKPDYRSLAGQGADVIIETSATRVGFLGGTGSNPPLSFFMIAKVRVIRLEGGAEIYSGLTSYIGRPHAMAEWAENNSAPLQQELLNAYASLAERSVEKLFLLCDFYSMGSEIWYCGLKPLYPQQTSYSPFAPGAVKIFAKKSYVDKLQPTFQWEGFPLDKDRQYDEAGVLGRISEVTYDLKVWKGRDGYPEDLIYERIALPAQIRTHEVLVAAVDNLGREDPTAAPHKEQVRIAEHRIDIPLEPSAEYFWSVRARFKLDGQIRVTKWAYSRYPNRPGHDPCDADHIPITHYHRFRTPKQ